MSNLMKYKFYYFVFSLLIILPGLYYLITSGLKLGIDFTGGAISEIEFNGERPDISKITEKVNALNFGNAIIQPTGDSGILVRTRDLTEAEHQALLKEVTSLGASRELRFDSIGPTIGRELRNRSIWAIGLVLVAIILYIAFVFRKVSKPVSSWFYGIFAVVALFHDILIPLGVFAYLGKFYGAEIDTLFVTAILTVLGFSVHDTIVVYDRVRENLKKQQKGEIFEDTVARSLSQTLTRSINTSLTVLLVLLALYLIGAESTKYFSLTLIIGIIAGTYSSIFIASSLLVTWNNFQNRRS